MVKTPALKVGWIVLVLVLLTAGTVWAAKYVWVASQGTVLKAKAEASSAVVTKLKLHERLSVLKRSGRWYHVRTERGKKGWVYRGRISGARPKKATKSSGVDLFGDMSSDIHADSATTDRAMRGLNAQTDQYAESTQTPQEYRKALDSVLNRSLRAQDIEEFLKKGKVGEYAQ